MAKDKVKKSSSQTYTVTVTRPGITELTGTVDDFDIKSGEVVFRHKKYGSNAFEFKKVIPISKIVGMAFVKGEEGSATLSFYDDTMTAFSYNDVSNIETIGNNLKQGKTPEGTIVVFDESASIEAEVRKVGKEEKKDKTKTKKTKTEKKSKDKKSKDKKKKENWDD